MESPKRKAKLGTCLNKKSLKTLEIKSPLKPPKTIMTPYSRANHRPQNTSSSVDKLIR